jgi:hypothetical protein
MRNKLFIAILSFLTLINLNFNDCQNIYAKGGSSSSSRSSSSSSRPSSSPSSRPSFSPSSRPSSSPSRPSVTTPPSSRPSVTTPPSSRPSVTTPPSSRPSVTTPPQSSKPSVTTPPQSSKPSVTTPPQSSKPSVTTPPQSSKPSVTTPPQSSKPSVTTPPQSSKPSVTTPPQSSKPSVTTPPQSSKPSVTTPPSNIKFDSAAGNAKKKEESKAVFAASNSKNTYVPQQPKSTYTTPNGKSVQIDKNAPQVSNIRNNLDTHKYETRNTRIEHHYHTHYGDRYGYYRSQPIIYVGGGYSSLFWYSMLDWSLERRAAWLYHNQYTIDSALYNQQLQNAELRVEIERLKARNVSVNKSYVDPEFNNNVDLMYDDNYVQAVYNPKIVTSTSWYTGLMIFLIFCGLFLLIWVLFFKKFNVNS